MPKQYHHLGVVGKDLVLLPREESAKVKETSRLHVDVLDVTWEPSSNFLFSEVCLANSNIFIYVGYH